MRIFYNRIESGGLLMNSGIKKVSFSTNWIGELKNPVKVKEVGRDNVFPYWEYQQAFLRSGSSRKNKFDLLFHLLSRRFYAPPLHSQTGSAHK